MVKEGYKGTEIGLIPEDWEVTTLKELSEVITKGTTPTTYGFVYEKTGVNFIKVENISDSGKIDILSTPKISQECNERLSRSIIRKNDILVSIAGTIGKTALVDDEHLPANTNQATQANFT